jgi:hypothetical protein
MEYCATTVAEGDIWSEERASSRGMKNIAQ